MDTCPIVGVASSAGDPEAICELLSALPAECSAAFVVVQHLDAGREKLLVGALAERTILPVLQARDGVAPERDHVYLISAGTSLTVIAGRMRVTPKTSELSHPADTLLISLAEQLGNRAVGVVLSGGGTDGALGIRAIKQAGGTTFAQYPGSARFPGMPISAIETGCVDLVLRPNEIAREVVNLSRRAAIPVGTARPMAVIASSADPGELPPLPAGQDQSRGLDRRPPRELHHGLG